MLAPWQACTLNPYTGGCLPVENNAASPCAGYLGYLFFQHVEDLFYQYGVDMVFTGHEHNYERTYPVYRDQVDSCE